MSKIAFYAPMKPPTHPTPSGDRAVARALLKALGRQAELVSDLRVYDGKGDLDAQKILMEKATTEAEKLIKQGQYQGWKAWFTYHNYYKSPDLLGPVVSKAMEIPYILLEATRAKKRLDGPWADFANRAEAACDQATVILYFTKRDQQALARYRPPDQRLIHLPPFLPDNTISAMRTKPATNTILSVGMMREGAKAASYALIAKTLNCLKNPNWHLDIAGNGPMRREIETLFKPFGARIRFLGQLDKTALAENYRNASLFLWPGVDEAFGMVYLEAQAAGLPIVAQNRPGLVDVIAPQTDLPPVDDCALMATEIDKLLNDPQHWQNRSQAGLEYVSQNHLLANAAKTLKAVIAGSNA